MRSSLPRNTFVAKFIKYNVVGEPTAPFQCEDLKIKRGGDDKITSVEFLGSIVRLKAMTPNGPLTIVQKDTEFELYKLKVGDLVTTSWLKKDQLQLEA